MINPFTGGQDGNWISNQALYYSAINGAYIAQQSALAQALTGSNPGLAQQGLAPACPRPPVENTGIVVGEIIGWRIWGLRLGYLASYSAGHTWAPDEPMQGKPSEDTLEGIWSFKQKSRALSKAIDGNYHWPSVVGSIKIWGEVIEYEEGYKCEFARVASIDDLFHYHWPKQWALAKLRRKYLRNAPMALEQAPAPD